MVDQERVCCMCGDIGFADKLFQCSCCRFRFQHLYCSNYYYGNHEISSSMKSMEICDWCQSEGRSNSSTSTNKSFKRSSSSSSMDHHHRSNSFQIRKQHHQDHHLVTNHNTNDDENTSVAPSPRGTSKNNSGAPSPRTGVHRRYKLLKDVMC